MPFLDYLPAIAGIGSALAGSSAASSSARAAGDTNALNRQALEWEINKQRPTVEGSSRLIDRYGQDDDQIFNPFVSRAGRGAGVAADVGSSYISNTQPYQEAGLQGVNAFRNLANTGGASNALSLASQFYNPFAEASYNLGADEINRQTERQRRENAIASTAGGSALSGQAARNNAFLEQGRNRELGRLGTQIGSQAFTQSLDEARRQRASDASLAGSLTGLGGTGLQQATGGFNLLSNAANLGITTPFAPYNAFNNAVSLGGLPSYQVQAQPSSLGAGIGAGIQGLTNLYRAGNYGR